MLIKAECLARKNDNKALDLLNQVLEERERELAGNGMRWFDMRRLAKQGLYTESLTRSNSTYSYTLKPDSPRYVFPICEYVLNLNPNIVQNER